LDEEIEELQSALRERFQRCYDTWMQDPAIQEESRSELQELRNSCNSAEAHHTASPVASLTTFSPVQHLQHPYAHLVPFNVIPELKAAFRAE